MPYEDYLPRAFRRKPPHDLFARTEDPLDRIQGYAGGTLGEQLGRVPNFAAPEDDPIHPIEKIWALGDPKNPVMVDPNAPLPPRPANLFGANQPPENVLAPPVQPSITPPLDAMPPVESARAPETRPENYAVVGKYDRPLDIGNIQGINPDERALARQRALEDYKPQKAKGFWDRWLKPALIGGGIGFLAGGPGGALGGAATNTLRSAFDPTAPNKDWRARELAKSGQEVQQVYSRRKAEDEHITRQLGQEKTAEDIRLSRARRGEIGKAKPGQVRMTDKGWAVIDPATSQAQPVVDPATGKQVQGEAKATEDLVVDANDPSIVHKYKNGKDTGVTYKVVPGYGNVPSGQAMTADATRENKTGEAQFTNEQVDRQVAALKARQQAMGGSPPLDVETEERNILGEVTGKTTKTNPRYTEWRGQYNDLQKQIDELEGKRKFVPQAGSTAKPSGQRYKVDPKFLQ